MNDHYVHMSRAGVAGGTLTVFLVNVTAGDIVKTMIMTCIGTVISFYITLLLKKIMEKPKE